MAVGTLAVGLLFIAGTFMTGIFLATVSTERTIAAVAADEAFAKVRLFGLDLGDPNLTTTGFLPYQPDVSMAAQEYLYPSIVDPCASQYSWAALCKRVSDTSRLAEVTVFVSRRVGTHGRYWVRQADAAQALEESDLPRPVRVQVEQDAAAQGTDELQIVDAVPGDNVDENGFIDDGSTLVCDGTGHIYRVLERYADRPDVIRLDRPWEEPDPAAVWVIPPPVSGGRNPFVAVYQRVLRFEAE